MQAKLRYPYRFKKDFARITHAPLYRVLHRGASTSQHSFKFVTVYSYKQFCSKMIGQDTAEQTLCHIHNLCVQNWQTKVMYTKNEG